MLVGEYFYVCVFLLFGNELKLLGRPESPVYQAPSGNGGVAQSKELRYGDNDRDWIISSESLSSLCGIAQEYEKRSQTRGVRTV